MQGFTRMLMTEIHTDVRREFPGIKVMRASVTGPSAGCREQFFVQFNQTGFPSFDMWVTAGDKYDARAKAWSAYLSLHFAASQSGCLAKLATYGDVHDNG